MGLQNLRHLSKRLPFISLCMAYQFRAWTRVAPNHGEDGAASDLKALGANWADGEAPSMDNPIGGIRRGWPAIREGYAKLFSGPATVRAAFHDFSAQGNNDYHLFVGREKGLCETPAVRLELRIRTSRWFVKVRGAWRQLHHHGSIDEPAMLAEYQRAIFEAPVKAAGAKGE
jgi:hypothetical protein